MTVDRPSEVPAASEEERRLRRLIDNLPAMVSYWDATNGYLKFGTQ